MADDPEFGIHFKTTSDSKGAVETKKAIEEVTKASKEGTEAQKTSTQAKEEASKKSKFFVEDVDKVAEATKKGTTAKQSLREALKGLALEFPLVARVMGLALTPMSALIAAFGALAAAVVRYQQEVNRSIASQAVEENLRNQVTQLATLKASYDATAESFIEKFNGIARAAFNAADGFETMNKEVAANQQLMDELADAETAAEKAKIRADPTLNGATRAQRLFEAEERGKVKRDTNALRAQQMEHLGLSVAIRREEMAEESAFAGLPSRDEFVSAKQEAEVTRARADKLKKDFEAASEAAQSEFTDIGASRSGTGIVAGLGRFIPWLPLVTGEFPRTPGQLDAREKGIQDKVEQMRLEMENAAEVAAGSEGRFGAIQRRQSSGEAAASGAVQRRIGLQRQLDAFEQDQSTREPIRQRIRQLESQGGMSDLDDEWWRTGQSPFFSPAKGRWQTSPQPGGGWRFEPGGGNLGASVSGAGQAVTQEVQQLAATMVAVLNDMRATFAQARTQMRIGREA